MCCLGTPLHGGNLFGSNDFMKSRVRSVEVGFDHPSNIFLITSFTFLSHLKPYTEHTFSSIVVKT